jgi:hypothetical protein
MRRLNGSPVKKMPRSGSLGQGEACWIRSGFCKFIALQKDNDSQEVSIVAGNLGPAKESFDKSGSILA